MAAPLLPAQPRSKGPHVGEATRSDPGVNASRASRRPRPHACAQATAAALVLRVRARGGTGCRRRHLVGNPPQGVPAYGSGAGITNRVGDPALFRLTFPLGRSRQAAYRSWPWHRTWAPGRRGVTVRPYASSGGPYLAARAVHRGHCHTFGPAAGSTLIVGPGTHDQLILVVCSSQVGKIVVTGAMLTYRDGVRFGRQHIGMATTATFTRSGVQAPVTGASR